MQIWFCIYFVNGKNHLLNLENAAPNAAASICPGVIQDRLTVCAFARLPGKCRIAATCKYAAKSMGAGNGPDAKSYSLQNFMLGNRYYEVYNVPTLLNH